MADDRVPDLSIDNLRKLTLGMTKGEVESVLGPYHRPNVHRGREFYVWIGEGAMLRARFDGPGETFSSAVVDWPEEQRVLEMGQQGHA